MLRVLKPSVLGIFLFSSLCTVGLSSTQVSAVLNDGWRDWYEMESGSYAVTYGSPAKIYACMDGVLSASLQVRNSSGAWKNMQTVTTKKSLKYCDIKGYTYVALFNGPVTALGKPLDNGLFLEMRLVSAATKKIKAWRSDPALIPQYKSYADKVGQIAEAMRKVLDKLFRGDDS